MKGDGLLLSEWRWVSAERGEMGCCITKTPTYSASLMTLKIRGKKSGLESDHFDKLSKFPLMTQW